MKAEDQDQAYHVGKILPVSPADGTASDGNWDSIHQSPDEHPTLPLGIPTGIEPCYSELQENPTAACLESVKEAIEEAIKRGEVDLDLMNGCTDCIHIHWRWGDPSLRMLANPDNVDRRWNRSDEKPLVPAGVNQTADFGIVRYEEGNELEVHPKPVPSTRDCTSGPGCRTSRPEVLPEIASVSFTRNRPNLRDDGWRELLGGGLEGSAHVVFWETTTRGQSGSSWAVSDDSVAPRRSPGGIFVLLPSKPGPSRPDTGNVNPTLEQCRSATAGADDLVKSKAPEFAARCWLLAFENGRDNVLATRFTDPQVAARVQAQDLGAWSDLIDVTDIGGVSGVSTFDFRCIDDTIGDVSEGLNALIPGAKRCLWDFPISAEDAANVGNEQGKGLGLLVVPLENGSSWAVEGGFIGP